MDDLERTLQGIPGYDPRSPLFELGEVRVTDSARDALAEAHDSDDPAHLEPYLVRHQAAEWDDLSDPERQTNLSAIEAGYEIRGRFTIRGENGKKLFIVTAEEGLGRRRPSTTVYVEAS